MLPIMMQTMHPGKFNICESHPLSTAESPKSEATTTTITAHEVESTSSTTSASEGIEQFDGQHSKASLNGSDEHCSPTEEAQDVESGKVKDSQNTKQSTDKSEAVSGADKLKHESNHPDISDGLSGGAANAPSIALGMSFNHELIQQTHSKLTNKFSQLESETGIRLRGLQSSHDNHCKQTNVNAKELNSHSVITSNNNNKQIRSIEGSIDTNGCIGNSQATVVQKKTNGNDEVKSLKEDLRLKNELIEKLLYIRSQVEAEIHDLTASLFEEANKMVQHANVLRQKAEQDSKDLSMQMEILSAENVALKNLVIHSTPSTPKKNVSFLHAAQRKLSTSKSKKGLPNKSPSNYELGASESNTNNDSQNKTNIPNEENNNESTDSYGDIDPLYYQEFKEWHKSPNLDASRSAFIKRIYDEEIYTVFNFRNKHLTSAIIRAIECNTLTVERIKGDPKDKFPRKCKLLDDYRPCIYRMRVDEGQWHYICSLSRERITTVCDLLCYLRYIKDGLVKSEPKEIFWQIMRKRHSITKARLGFLSAC